MARYNKLLYFLLTVGIIALLGCAYWCLQQFTSRQDRSLLIDAPFVTPGWQGIVPGQSTREEAAQILTRSPHVRRASIWATESQYTAATSIELVHWDDESLALFPCGGALCNRMIITNNTVQLIEIALNYEVRAAQVIDHFGTPQYIIRCQQEDWRGALYTAIYLWYGIEGLAFHTRGAYSIHEGLLVPTSPAMYVYYFEPQDLEEFIAQLGPYIYLCQTPQIQEWSEFDHPPTP